MNKAEQIINLTIENALREDLSENGDITSKSVFPKNPTVEAVIKSKADGVLSGVYLIEPIFKKLDERVEINTLKNDSDSVKFGDIICTLKGPIIAILSGERLALNFLQRLSGIATASNELSEIIKETNARLLDTRKTTPTLRYFEKEAVKHGGGVNHRFGLSDMVLIKDTHVKATGGPGNAVALVKNNLKDENIGIEVEVQSIEEFWDAANESPDRIMLDNMTNSDMKKCVDLRNEKFQEIELEASGNIDNKRILDIAGTGVDFISVGAITHSVKALDIHLVIL